MTTVVLAVVSCRGAVLHSSMCLSSRRDEAAAPAAPSLARCWSLAKCRARGVFSTKRISWCNGSNLWQNRPKALEARLHGWGPMQSAREGAGGYCGLHLLLVPATQNKLDRLIILCDSNRSIAGRVRPAAHNHRKPDKGEDQNALRAQRGSACLDVGSSWNMRERGKRALWLGALLALAMSSGE